MISARKDIIIIPTEDANTETSLEAFTIIKIIIIIIIIIIIMIIIIIKKHRQLF